MTPLKLAEYIRLKTRTNSTTLSNADIITLANQVKDRLILQALEADEDLFLVPTYLDLVANRREYPLHTDTLSRIKRVEAKLNGTDFVKLHEFDLTQYKGSVSSEANITGDFGNGEGEAFFDMMRGSIWIYSGTITSVTAGLRIWLNTTVLDITNLASTTDMSDDPTTTTHGIPKPLHHALATGVIIDWKESREKPIPLSETERMYDLTVRKAVASLKRGNYDRDIIGSVPCDNGGQY